MSGIGQGTFAGEKSVGGLEAVAQQRPGILRRFGNAVVEYLGSNHLSLDAIEGEIASSSTSLRALSSPGSGASSASSYYNPNGKCFIEQVAVAEGRIPGNRRAARRAIRNQLRVAGAVTPEGKALGTICLRCATLFSLDPGGVLDSSGCEDNPDISGQLKVIKYLLPKELKSPKEV